MKFLNVMNVEAEVFISLKEVSRISKYYEVSICKIVFKVFLTKGISYVVVPGEGESFENTTIEQFLKDRIVEIA
jgi:hypothetical protein